MHPPSEYSGKGSISDLPDDALLAIFTHLNFKEWLLAEGVSSRWKTLLLCRWRTLRALNVASLIGVSTRPVCAMASYQAAVPKINTAILQSLATRCAPFITSVKLGAKIKVSIEGLKIVADEFVNVVTLDLSGAIILDSDFEEAPSLPQSSCDWPIFGKTTSLKLERCFDESTTCYYDDGVSDSLTFALIQTVPLVERLYLGENSLLFGECLTSINAEKLSHLNLDFCRRIPTGVLRQAFQGLAGLREVSLYSNNLLEGSALLALPETLTALDVSFCNSLTPDVLIEFLNSHLKLEKLSASYLTGLTNDVLRTIGDLPQLKELALTTYYCMSLCSEANFTLHKCDISTGLNAIANNTTLEMLDLTNNGFVTDAHLQKMCTGLKHSLKVLKLNGVVGLTNVGFFHICALKNLQCLEVSGNDNIDPEMLVTIAHHTNIQTVSARNCGSVSERTLKTMSDSWPRDLKTIFDIY